MTRIIEELADPLLLAAHDVPARLLRVGFGHSDMFWYRLIEPLGRSSLMGTTVRDPARLPGRLAADEHHVDRGCRKGYVATTVGGGCVPGPALTAAADDAHLREAYGVFTAEMLEADPEYASATVNTDARAARWNAFPGAVPGRRGGALFPARVAQGLRPLSQGPRVVPPGVGRLPRRHLGGVPSPDGRALAVVRHTGLDRPGGGGAEETVG